MLKSLSITFLACLSLSASASLLDHTVYTTEGISAECSDFLGKTSSGGPIALRDFLIDDASNTYGCALNSAASVSFLRGKVLKNTRDAGCISTPRLNQAEVSYHSQQGETVDVPGLKMELANLSHALSSGKFHGAKTVRTELPQGLIEISGSSSELIILSVPGKHPVLVDTGVTIKGSISADRIIWHFPEAETLTITRSGMDPADLGFNMGLPGTFVAPKAVVTFQNALITGALYARKLNAPADRKDCSGVVSGQINSASLRLGGKGK